MDTEIREGSAAEVAHVKRLTEEIRKLVSGEEPAIIETALCNLLAGQIAAYAGKDADEQNKQIAVYDTLIVACLMEANSRTRARI